MEIIFKEKALSDIEFWKKSGNIQIQNKISALIEDTLKHPETGIGKPEKLKHQLFGLWSRRINNEHRMIYMFTDEVLYIASLKGHY